MPTAELARRIGAALMAAIVLTAAHAKADGLPVDVDESTIAATGSVTGFPSGQNFTTRQPGDDAVLYGIRGDEKSDHPCYLELLWSRQTMNVNELFTTTWHREPCDGDLKGDEEVKLAQPAPAQAISGLQVCNTSKDNRRLKGVRITKAAELTTSGSRHLAGDPDVDGKFQRPNCADWDAAASCPDGKIVVGVNIYHDEEGATGLEPICAAAKLVAPAVGLYTARDPARPEMLSPVAGVASPPSRQLRVMIGKGVSLPNDPTRDYGITSVLLEEAGDKPCRVALWGGALDGDKGPDGRKLAEARLDGCNTGGLIDILRPSLKEYPDRFLAAVDVCDSKNRNNDRIKGLRLRGAQLRTTGVHTLEETAADFQPHCGVSSGWAECQGWNGGQQINGTIAVGLIMHHDGKAFTGIQLVCQYVYTGAPQTLAKDAIGY